MTISQFSSYQDFLSAVSSKGSTNSTVEHLISVLLFYRSDHPQSIQMTTVMDLVEHESSSTAFYNICLDSKSPAEIRSNWGPLNISTIPCVVLLKGLRIIARVEGANPNRLVNLIKQLEKGEEIAAEEDNTRIISCNKNESSAHDAVPAASAADAAAVLKDRLTLLIKSSPVFIFIKGEKTNPFCRFSKQAIGILNSLNVDFASFDVLSDSDVREGLKTFSNWPTFPQLYIKSTFIGGVDIMNQMFQDGSLETMLAEFRQQQVPAVTCNDPSDVAVLNSYLRSLINRHPVMVFMKGEKSNPFCRFSKQLMQIFDDCDVRDFETFNILNDDIVREGLKQLSSWPTYPQIYVKGRLLGGVDVVRSIVDQGGSQALRDEIKQMMAMAM